MEKFSRSNNCIRNVGNGTFELFGQLPAFFTVSVPVMKNFVFIFLITLISVSCEQTNNNYDPGLMVNEAITVHGSFKDKTVSFTFRDREYSVTRDDSGYTYTRAWEDDSLGSMKDILVNGRHFTRRVNGEKVSIDNETADKYSNSVNSVLYFFQLPFVLNDKSAIKKYVGEFTIKDEPYHCVQVTFTEEGGGKDFEDVFFYWIHEKKKTIDFMAYSYLTDGGGVRFREAINRREIKGLLIQDYVNHAAEKSTPLETLPKLFEEGKLENLSMIINENVRVTNIK